MKIQWKIIDFQHILKYELEYKVKFWNWPNFSTNDSKKYVAPNIDAKSS